jgi:hypothetical protein
MHSAVVGRPAVSVLDGAGLLTIDLLHRMPHGVLPGAMTRLRSQKDGQNDSMESGFSSMFIRNRKSRQSVS